MADVDDITCAPPVFLGDPESTVSQAANSFSWIDLMEGCGDFCVDKNIDSFSKWKQMSSTNKGGVSVTTYTRPVEGKGGLSEFLIRGGMPISRDSYFCVNSDMEHRPEWDETCVSVAELSSSGPGPDAGPYVERNRILHWVMNYPWPLGKRDYVLEQTIQSGLHHDGRVYRCSMGRSVDPEVSKKLRPVEKTITRIEDFRNNVVIWSGATERECCFAIVYFEDGKLSAPNWVLTKAAITTIPTQIAGFVPAAGKYPKKRLQQLLTRFGAGRARGDRRESITDTEVGEPDEETFFSASDNEAPEPPATPLRTTIGRTPATPAPRSPAMLAASKVAFENAAKTSAQKVAAATKHKSVKPKDRKLASKLESALRLVLPHQADSSRSKPDSDDEADLEEGVLIVGKEERDLLLNLLAEARAKQSGSWWWCPCRRRCGMHKSRHKQ